MEEVRKHKGSSVFEVPAIAEYGVAEGLLVKEMAEAVLDSARRDVLLDDSEDALPRNPARREEQIANKISAWEWFFGQTEPRWPLDQVCTILDRDPEHERRMVRSKASPPRHSMSFRCRAELFGAFDRSSERSYTKRNRAPLPVSDDLEIVG